MDFYKLTRKELEPIAAEVGTSTAYLLQIKYRKRRPGPELAEKIEKATNGQVNRLQLLYPYENGSNLLTESQ